MEVSEKAESLRDRAQAKFLLAEYQGSAFNPLTDREATKILAEPYDHPELSRFEKARAKLKIFHMQNDGEAAPLSELQKHQTAQLFKDALSLLVKISEYKSNKMDQARALALFFTTILPSNINLS
jgi:hypothetical protein